MASTSPTPEEILWRQYALFADLYKTYITASIQLTVFVYAVTGGIVSYFLVHSNVSELRWSLVLPLILNGGITFLYFGGLPLLTVQQQQMVNIAGQLSLPALPSDFVLRVLLWMFGSLHLLTVGGLVLLVVSGGPKILAA